MRWIIAALVMALLTLSGCGTTTAGDARAAGGDPMGTGKTADYDFAGTTLSGTAFEGSSLEGAPAVLWFWAPWCPTCRAQSVNVSALAQKYQGKVALVGVGGLDSGPAIEDLAGRIPSTPAF